MSIVSNVGKVRIDRDVLQRVVAVINGKGGVGKTTLTANAGGLAARSAYKVLMVDMDPQGNLGLDLGYADGDDDDAGRSLSAALQGLTSEVRLLRGVRENLDVIVGGSALHGASAVLAAGQRGSDARDALACVLSPLAADYDLILIDCPPGNESLQTAAIGAARWVVAPSKVDEGTGRGLMELAERLEQVVAVNPDLDLLGVVLFDVEKSATRVEREARQMVADVVGSEDVLFTTSIRHSTAVAQQARRYGKLVHELEEYAKTQPEWWRVRRGEASGERVTSTASNVAEDLHALTQEIVQRIASRESLKVSS